MQYDRRTKLGILVILAVFVVSIVAIVLYQASHKRAGFVYIDGLEQCSKGIRDDNRDGVFSAVYGFVKLANDYNKKPTAKYYKGNVRDKSCAVQSDKMATSVFGKAQRVVSTRAIVDIPEAQQSWQVDYEWTNSRGQIVVVINGATPACVDKKDLVYGDFNCEKILNLQKYGTEKYDPILRYMPYTGQGFKLAFDPNTKTVTATILVPQKDLNNTALIENDKAAVLYWFSHRQLDIKNYTVVYAVAAE